MRRFVATGAATLSLLAWSGSLSARQAPAKPDMSSITEASIRGHMEFLASDALNGRGSGTRDEWIAATYMASRMRSWGIEPIGDDGGYVQAVEASRSEATAPPVLSFGSTTLTHGKEMLVQSMGRPHLSGPVVKFTGGTNVQAGSIVLMPEAPPAHVPAPPAGGGQGRGGQPQYAIPGGAAGVLIIETDQTRANWATAAARMPTVNAKLADADKSPSAFRIVLSKDAYAQVAAMSDGQIASFDCTLKQGYTWNAIGQLKGTDPKQADEVILLTAHLDHLGNRANASTPPGTDTIFNGADDDASGSTAVLELAEALARSPRSKRTVMFAWFGSEESGGAGARNFLDHPPVPLDHITANLEFEMIARRDEKVPPHTLWLTGYERSNLGPELAKQGAKIVQDPHPEQNFFSRSDNIQLARRGVIAHTVSSFGLHTDYHRVSDEIKTVDFPQMTDAIQSMFAPVLYLLNSTFKPAWNPGGQPK